MSRRRTEHDRFHDLTVFAAGATAIVWLWLLSLLVTDPQPPPPPPSGAGAEVPERAQAAHVVSRGNARTSPPPPSATPRATTTPTVAVSSGKSTGDGGGRWPWDALAACESSGNPRAVSVDGTYRGLYQFDRPTWRAVGGTGDPAAASRAEQLRRAVTLQARRGWSPWPQCAQQIGLLP